MRLRFLAAATLSLGSHAYALDIRCTFPSTVGAGTYDAWIQVEPQSNLMRVEGQALPLIMTNENYASRTPVVANFITVRRIDRQTGEITVSTLYGNEVKRVEKGMCQQATPPATKF